MRQLFYVVIPFSTLVGVLAFNIWAALIPLGWVGGINWLIAVTRHGDMFNEIMEHIKQKDDEQLENHDS